MTEETLTDLTVLVMTTTTMTKTNSCCAECGEEGGVSLKVCKACMHIRYCNAICQRNHWSNHKKDCKRRAAELRDEALFKAPPAKEDCPICFLPMPLIAFSCASLPDATILSVPIFDFAMAHDDLDDKTMEQYYTCCGKSICKGCVYSFIESGNIAKCPFCNSERGGLTEEERFEEVMKRVAVNDAGAIYLLGNKYYHGAGGLRQDHAKAIDLFNRSANLGFSKAHSRLGYLYHDAGDLKRAKSHYEAAAMDGHERARCIIGTNEAKSENVERAIKHWAIAASAGCFRAMQKLRIFFERGHVSRESIDSILAAYNKSCAEMRSKARDKYIKIVTETG